MSRTVAGTLLLPNGQPMANARIFFTAKRTEAVSIVEGVNTFFSTGSNGAYSQSIVNGWYSVSIEWDADIAGSTVRRWKLGDAFVEDGAATTLEALLIASNPDVSVDVTLLYEVLEQAQQAAQNAQASAVAAAASAASVTPTTGPNDTTPGHLWRTDDLVKVKSLTDTTPGSVPMVGWMGWGSNNPPVTGNLNEVGVNSLLLAPSSGLNKPIGANGPVLSLFGLPGWGQQQFFPYSPGSYAYRRVWVNSVPESWLHYWDSGNLAKTASRTDTTAGKMLQVGDGGLLGIVQPLTGAVAEAPSVVSSKSVSGFESRGAYNGIEGRYPVGIRLGGSSVSVFLGFDHDIGQMRITYLTSTDSVIRRTLWDTGNTSTDVQAMLRAPNNTAIRAAIGTSSLPPYTLGTVPSAVANANLLIVITDLAGGREPCFSDGINWLRCSDKSIVN